MKKHSIKAGYVRGQFWVPIDNFGSVTVYKGPPMTKKEAGEACAVHGDVEYWIGGPW